MKALIVLLVFLSGPSKDAFKIHITKVERTGNAYFIRAHTDKIEYRMHCSMSGDFCHMPKSGAEYLADDSKPHGNLVVYGIDQDTTIYFIDSEEEIRK